MKASGIVEGGHGVTLTDVISTVQCVGGKPGQGYAAVLVIGYDMYNISTTGKVSKTLNCSASDSDHVPVVARYQF